MRDPSYEEYVKQKFENTAIYSLLFQVGEDNPSSSLQFTPEDPNYGYNRFSVTFLGKNVDKETSKHNLGMDGVVVNKVYMF